ncbi:MAG: glycosyltransferase family 39 protein [Chloroflexi bacterium]|nr:glycosyltransferase family 39 protein [Chloroflexota bacterium]
MALLTRLPLATQMLYSWDSVNFAFAMQRFDVTHYAPHPPGYLYYVGLARLFDLALHDANASLVLVSILFAGLSVAALFCLGRTAFDRATGVIAALSLLGSVTFWAYGVIALSYMTLAFFSIATAWLAYLILFRGARQKLLLLTVVYCIGGGFRPDLLLFLAPLWLVCLARASWRERLLNAVLALAGFAFWFVPVVWLSGGLSKYLAVCSAYFFHDVLERYSVMNGGRQALVVNVRDLTSYIFYALYAQTLLFLAAAIWLIWRGAWRERTWLFVAVWIVPMLAFYTFIHIGDPGYIFAFLPALSLLIGWFARQAWPRAGFWPGRPGRRRAGSLVALGLVAALAVNAYIFLMVDKPLTARGIRRNDHILAERMAYVRANYEPDEVVLLSYASFKHTLYYLPRYRYSFWVDRFSRRPRFSQLPPGVRYVLILDDDLPRLVRYPGQWETIDISPGDRVRRLEVHREHEILYGDEEIEVE